MVLGNQGCQCMFYYRCLADNDLGYVVNDAAGRHGGGCDRLTYNALPSQYNIQLPWFDAYSLAYVKRKGFGLVRVTGIYHPPVTIPINYGGVHSGSYHPSRCFFRGYFRYGEEKI